MHEKQPIKTISELFNEATFDERRLIDRIYHPYIPLQIYNQPLRFSITKEQYEKFAQLLIQECITIINDAAIHIDNNIFNDNELLIKLDKSHSSGLRYAIEIIENHFK